MKKQVLKQTTTLENIEVEFPAYFKDNIHKYAILSDFEVVIVSEYGVSKYSYTLPGYVDKYLTMEPSTEREFVAVYIQARINTQVFLPTISE